MTDPKMTAYQQEIGAYVTRLNALLNRAERAEALLQECVEVLDNYSDITDDDNGPKPNKAMRMQMDIEEFLEDK